MASVKARRRSWLVITVIAIALFSIAYGVVIAVPADTQSTRTAGLALVAIGVIALLVEVWSRGTGAMTQQDRFASGSALIALLGVIAGALTAAKGDWSGAWFLLVMGSLWFLSQVPTLRRMIRNRWPHWDKQP